MRALVLGSAGFVGRHVSRALVERGDYVLGVDLRDDYSSVVTEFWGGDVRWWLDEDLGHFDLVVHCAAVVGGRSMIDGHPLHVLSEDLGIDAALFRWALRANPGRIVYYSSSAAYPTALQGHVMPQPLRECDINPTFPSAPDQTYGWVKLTGERLAAEANAAGIKTHVFRPFSGYGSDQDMDYPFPSIIERARRGDNPIKLWSNGVRDWVHIDDIVGATLAAVEQDVLGPVNICTGRATSFAQLAKMSVEVSDPRAVEDARFEVLEGMPTGVHHRVGDPTEMLKFYTPQVTLEEGIRRALDG